MDNLVRTEDCMEIIFAISLYRDEWVKSSLILMKICLILKLW
jgi:hypothetical protein